MIPLLVATVLTCQVIDATPGTYPMRQDARFGCEILTAEASARLRCLLDEGRAHVVARPDVNGLENVIQVARGAHLIVMPTQRLDRSVDVSMWLERDDDPVRHFAVAVSDIPERYIRRRINLPIQTTGAVRLAGDGADVLVLFTPR